MAPSEARDRGTTGSPSHTPPARWRGVELCLRPFPPTESSLLLEPGEKGAHRAGLPGSGGETGDDLGRGKRSVFPQEAEHLHSASETRGTGFMQGIVLQL